ncbi:MAG TPA: hypothetical protein VND40_01685 [Nitrososphaerales archaeon]|nr:hypothetical protein [Nitrososphaerales archaeon]
MSRRAGVETAKATGPASRAEADPNTQTILSVLKTYPSNEVAIVGCHTARMSRKSCEYDLLVVSKDPTPPKYVRIGEFYAKIIFRSERELRDPEPELSAALARATVLRDGSLLLAGTVASCRRKFKDSCGKAAESHLAAALKALGRVDEKVGGNFPEADFWLTSAATDLCVAEIFSSLQVPSPSHLFAQMKGLSKRKSAIFKEWTDASGFKLASRSFCENRLEALSVIYDVLRTTAMDMPMSLRFGRYRSEDAVAIVRGKALELLESRETVECYSFLGYEIVRTVLDLHAMHRYALKKEPDYSNVTGELTSGPDRLISEDLLKAMGIVRQPELVKAGADSLRSAVSALAARI